MALVGLLCQSGLLLLVVVATQFALSAQTQFAGKLDGQLYVDPDLLGVATFDAVSAGDPKLLSLRPAPNDKVFAGVLSLSDRSALQYKTVIVRSPDGTDAIYIDANQDGHFGPGERIVFHGLEPAAAGVKNSAKFVVAVPDGYYRTCPMEVRLMKDGFPTPAGPRQLAVLYTSSVFLQGYVPLPKRRLHIRFAYGFRNEGIDLGSAPEWVDINGDGRFDATPGSAELLDPKGSAPVFRVENLTLQLQSIDMKQGRFLLRSVPAALYQRIPFSVGSVLPDFEFTDFAGRRRHLSDVKGQYILLDFWATWCGPCVAELAVQKKAYEEFHSQGFEILGMDGDGSLQKAEALLKKDGIAWMQARFDKHLFEDRFQISQWPTTILIDRHHVILSIGEASHLPLRGGDLSKSLQSLLRETASRRTD